MPVTPTYPGVYIEEIPSGVRTITGVSTSIAAFVGYAARGPLNKAVRIFNFGDYERTFGGLDRNSEVSYSVQQFFLNGGTDAYVVRVASGATSAKASLQYTKSDNTNGNALTVSAIDPGKWGENLSIKVDYDTADPDNTFNLSVLQQDIQTGRLSEAEAVHRNLSMNSQSPSYVVDVVNATSKLIKLELDADFQFDDANDRGYSLIGDLTTFPALTDENAKITVVLNGDQNNPHTLTLWDVTNKPTDLGGLVTQINAAISGSSELQTRLEAVRADDAGADAATGNFLKLKSVYLSTDNDTDTKAEVSAVSVVATSENDAAPALKLGLDNGGTKEIVGAGLRRPTATNQAQLQGGFNGKPPANVSQIEGSENDKTGIYALKDVDLFNLLLIPGTTKFADAAAKSLLDKAIAFCEKQRAFLIIDPPETKKHSDIQAWVETNATANRNSAVFFPWLQVADPQQGFRLRNMPPSGAIAGIFARTDSERGVWKAPAGIDATVRGAQGLSQVLNDQENGVLNIKGINCLRTFPTYGMAVWGSRTRKGDDAQADEYKYIPVRRLLLFLQESLYRGTQWVVFEPNDEPLWAQIRLNLGAFMNNLFRQGAFQGDTPSKAYFVKCDKETNPQNDIDRGIVNIIVGFAPLKPAEFVIIKFQQIAGDIAT